ncbi:MAG: hypothetical protein ACFB0D_04135 [Phormidesmis sp.]
MVVRAKDGYVESMVRMDAVVNAIALDSARQQIIAATKAGIQALQIGA